MKYSTKEQAAHLSQCTELLSPLTACMVSARIWTVNVKLQLEVDFEKVH